MTTEKNTGPEFILTREFNAPRELVWKAWTEADCLAQWWGPKGFEMKVISLDFRPGGIYHYSMLPPGGELMWAKFVFQEIVVPEKIVYILSFSDENQGIQRHFAGPEWPLEMLNKVTLSEKNGKTTVTLSSMPINATEKECQIFADGFESMQQGWTGTLDQLEDYLASA